VVLPQLKQSSNSDGSILFPPSPASSSHRNAMASCFSDSAVYTFCCALLTRWRATLRCFRCIGLQRAAVCRLVLLIGLVERLSCLGRIRLGGVLVCVCPFSLHLFGRASKEGVSCYWFESPSRAILSPVILETLGMMTTDAFLYR